MNVTTFDLETYLIRRPIAAPRPVCLSRSDDGQSASLHQFSCGGDALQQVWQMLRSGRRIVNTTIAFDFTCLMAMEPDLIRPIFDLYMSDMVEDIVLNQKLLDIASGRLKYWKSKGYALDRLAKRHEIGLEIDKDDPYRMRYGEFDLIPMRMWPEGAREYPKLDAIAPHRIHASQHVQDAEHVERFGSRVLHQAPRRALYDLALRLAHIYGVRTDGEKVAKLRKATEERMYELWKHGWTEDTKEKKWHAPLAGTGLIDAKGTKKKAAAAARIVEAFHARGERIPVTKAEAERRAEAEIEPADSIAFEEIPEIEKVVKKATKKRAEERVKTLDLSMVSTERDTCILSGDEQLIEWADYGRTKLILSRLDDLAQGADLPLQPRYDSLLESGRTSSSKGEKRAKADRRDTDLVGVQIQNFPRSPDRELQRVSRALFGEVIDARGCLKPRPGHGYGLADYSSGELHTLAQVCRDLFGYSKLGDMLNAGIDVHLWFGVLAYGGGKVTYDEAKVRLAAGDQEVKAWRQSAKPIVFGRPGGMGRKKMIVTARKSYGVRFTTEEVGRLIRLFDEAFDEVAELFDLIKGKQNGPRGLVRLQQLRSLRWRGGCTYSAACNTLFQGLLADGALEALAHVQFECYACPESPLYGYRTVAFVHDEIVIEGPLGGLAAATERLSKLMEHHLDLFAPDYPTPAHPVLTMVWNKDAGTVRDEEGKLQLWVPKKKAA